MEHKATLPNYENCIANVPNSVMKHFGIIPPGKSLPLLDEALGKDDYTNVVVFLLDGLGYNILKENLEQKGFLRSHNIGIISSVFPSSTVPATTSILSGLLPCEHSWLGWDCYYPQVDKNVTVFRNTEQGTETPAASYHIAHTYTGYLSVQSRFEQAGKKAYVISPFEYPYPTTFESICNGIAALCNQFDKKIIYAYWPEPDSTIHMHGCYSEETKQVLKHLEEEIEALCKTLIDTLVVISSDHGFKDCKSVCIKDYPTILDCLVRMPSIEPRAMNLYVKKDMNAQFEEEFNRHFGDHYLLLPKKEVIERKLFGTGAEHECFRAMLGDYLAIAFGDLAIYNSHKKANQFVAHHGGLTKDEMEVPLITFDLQADLEKFLNMFWGNDSDETTVIPLGLHNLEERPQ